MSPDSGDRLGRLALLLAVVFLAAGAALRAAQAADPYDGRQSTDERAYAGLAIALAEHGSYGSPAQRDPWHWPPGAPAVFAAAHLVAPGATDAETPDIPAAYWAQALAGTVTIVLAWAIAHRLGGPWAGAAAAGAVALYPPLVSFTGEQLSEPIGAAAVSLAVLTLVSAWQRGRSRRFLLTGGTLALAILVRADLLPVLVTLGAGITVAVLRRDGRRAALEAAAAFGLGCALVLGPWIAVASAGAGTLTPVTSGGSSALFVGTYLPGGGTTEGAKDALASEVADRFPRYADRRPQDLPAAVVLDAVAARHPDLDRDTALRRESLSNLMEYGLGDPVRFAGMMAYKTWRMWGQPARGGAIPESAAVAAVHLTLTALALAGIVAGVHRARQPLLILGVIPLVTLTALHTVAVSQARYALPMMPTLFALGAAGWRLARHR